MSATGFQRRRREMVRKEVEEKEQSSQLELEGMDIESIKKHTNNEIKARLDELGIEYKTSDNKDALIALLTDNVPEGGVKETNEEGEPNGEGETEQGDTKGQKAQAEQDQKETE